MDGRPETTDGVDRRSSSLPFINQLDRSLSQDPSLLICSIPLLLSPGTLCRFHSLSHRRPRPAQSTHDFLSAYVGYFCSASTIIASRDSVTTPQVWAAEREDSEGCKAGVWLHCTPPPFLLDIGALHG